MIVVLISLVVIESELFVVGDFFGLYRLICEFGWGGMGVVWEVEEEFNGCWVVIKLFL